MSKHVDSEQCMLCYHTQSCFLGDQRNIYTIIIFWLQKPSIQYHVEEENVVFVPNYFYGIASVLRLLNHLKQPPVNKVGNKQILSNKIPSFRKEVF